MAKYGEDVDLRKKYAAAHKQCQLSSLLFSFGEIPTAHAPAAHTHHIFGGVARVDNWSNLIRLSAEAHDWCHDDARSKVACLYQKIALSRLWLPEIEDACRTHRIIGWLENVIDGNQDPLVKHCGPAVLRHLIRQTTDTSHSGVKDGPERNDSTGNAGTAR